MIWGANWAIVKIGSHELAPLFMAALRSLVASACLYIWMKAKKITIFPSKQIVFHGVIVGLLFGTEFAFIYAGLKYTLASRTYILLYTAPFFVAIGAHFFLINDRINPWKAGGLILAFVGVVTLFAGNLGSFSLSYLPGDAMALAGGAMWGATTVYLKKYLSPRTLPLQILFYQVFFSAPLLFLMSIILEDPLVMSFSMAAAFSVFYQCIIVAFLSYLVWLELVQRYPVSLLHAFSYFTPVFGVLLSGALILGEAISLSLMISLALVSLGMVLINHRPEPT